MRTRSFHDNAGKTSLNFKIMYNKWRLGKGKRSSGRLTAQLSTMSRSEHVSSVDGNPSVRSQVGGLRDFSSACPRALAMFVEQGTTIVA